MKKKTRKHSISYDAANCKHHNHRPTFTDCPHCNHKMDYGDWDKAGRILVVAEIQCKHGSVGLLSECPKCFKLSWIHLSFSSTSDHLCEMYGWPLEWAVAAKKEEDYRHMLAVKELKESLCVSCKHLVGLEINTICIKTCAVKPNSGFRVETECDKYKEIK